jgi:hypothetical protein
MKTLFAVCLLVVFAGFILYSTVASVNVTAGLSLSGGSTLQAEGSPLPWPHVGTSLESRVL